MIKIYEERIRRAYIECDGIDCKETSDADTLEDCKCMDDFEEVARKKGFSHCGPCGNAESLKWYCKKCTVRYCGSVHFVAMCPRMFGDPAECGHMHKSEKTARTCAAGKAVERASGTAQSGYVVKVVGGVYQETGDVQK